VKSVWLGFNMKAGRGVEDVGEQRKVHPLVEVAHEAEGEPEGNNPQEKS
jgi:hypothetical protein